MDKKRVAWNKGATKKCYSSYCNNIIPIYRKYCSRDCYWEDKKGSIPWNKGKTGIYSEEIRQKQSERMNGCISPNKGKRTPEETKQKISEARKGHIVTEETRNQIANSMKGNIPWNKGLTKEINNKILDHSIIMKNKWQGPEFVKKQMKSRNVYPNKTELSLQDIINSIFFEGQFIYVGDGQEIIGGKCPDFIDKTNNKIIELYGDYWHRNDDPNDRINYFKDYGYNTLVIWESELKDVNNLKNKLLGFLNAE